MWPQRQNGMYCRQAKEQQGLLGTPETRRKTWDRLFPTVFREWRALLTPWCWTSSLQTPGEQISFVFNHLALWYFVTAGIGDWCKLSHDNKQWNTDTQKESEKYNIWQKKPNPKLIYAVETSELWLSLARDSKSRERWDWGKPRGNFLSWLECYFD